jgi:hypothetical protein
VRTDARATGPAPPARGQGCHRCNEPPPRRPSVVLMFCWRNDDNNNDNNNNNDDNSDTHARTHSTVVPAGTAAAMAHGRAVRAVCAMARAVRRSVRCPSVRSRSDGRARHRCDSAGLPCRQSSESPAAAHRMQTSRARVAWAGQWRRLRACRVQTSPGGQNHAPSHGRRLKSASVVRLPPIPLSSDQSAPSVAPEARP